MLEIAFDTISEIWKLINFGGMFLNKIDDLIFTF